MVMLKNIEKIDWSNLKTASGTASEVPRAIRDLTSVDSKTRERAYWQLDNHVVLQSDLYESAYFVVPFLIEILDSKIIDGREYVYDLLFEIANGYAPEDEICVYDGCKIYIKQGTRDRVVAGIETYMKEILDTSSNCRSKALELVVSLKEKFRTIVPELQEAIAREASRDFKRELTEALSEISVD
ncbi:hypothetical protein [Pseudobacteriovorax antillogorgiicola]|uniref:HEAT repeat domain-containing protein n=1 Tax=Pseudobacteriovorax antillogorgiicola TaxID=1513793 RepID=A0A1Y6C263_9BACT|nr:hypothetical protein [Pseudobacteriovorax antillogorgiicola]TCS50775.1 hypothetical protein EDD56_112158 [Pseudobacteriovorax antillogorgiicola]SMF41371.1 hypothetical protein SAMN06296036_112157 [Pseudobacteriovorax antillogorgiicola]